MSSRKNLRFVKVKTIIPSDNVREILVNSSVNSHLVKEHVSNESLDIRKNADDNTALIQKDLSNSVSSLENIIEKVLYISCISILINVVVLCIC